MLTQLFLTGKKTLKELNVVTATVVIGESVLAQDDRTADVTLCAFTPGSLFVSSAQDFTLRSLHASIDGYGVFQLQAPVIEVQGRVELDVKWNACTLAVSAARMIAKEITLSAIKQSAIAVHSTDLSASVLSSMVGIFGATNAGGIVADKVEGFIGWLGCILLSALEYTSDLPMVVTESTWLCSRKNKAPSAIVNPVVPRSAASRYEFREPPACQPVAVHYHVTKQKYRTCGVLILLSCSIDTA